MLRNGRLKIWAAVFIEKPFTFKWAFLTAFVVLNSLVALDDGTQFIPAEIVQRAGNADIGDHGYAISRFNRGCRYQPNTNV